MNAVVTGGGKGIGRALCGELAGAGMAVVVAERDEAAGRAAMSELNGQGHTSVFVPTDVADAASVEALAAAAREAVGEIHLLINNAGISMPSGPCADADLAAWRHVVDVNLWGVIHGVRAFAPVMKRHTGWRHICNIGSMASMRPIAGIGAYCASKSGVHALTEVLRMELIEHGIGVSLAVPGATATSILGRRSPATRSSIEGRRPPQDVARAIVDGIVADRFYIITHPEAAPLAAPRLGEIQAAFRI